MNEIHLIREIITFHPVYNAGISRGLSFWQKGGFGGAGGWYLEKLIQCSWEQLAECLCELKLEETEFGFRWNEQLIKA